MGLFALNWGLASAREGKRQKCGGMILPEDDEHQDACLYDPYLQQQRSFYGLHHYQQQLQLSPPASSHQQQQEQHRREQQLLGNLQALKERSRQEMFLSRMNFSTGSELHSIQQHQQRHQQQQHVSEWNHHQSEKLNALKSSTYHESRSPAAAAAAPAAGEAGAAHEHLFYKVVTPSDVGKLNRLVIPKQHAERWFPLDPCLRKKGRLLSFQDVVSRELWWFRYSYWSSSQSYVLTKGWIRFVKDKDLQAGDIISFERGARHELYINCRKRPTSGRAFTPPSPGDEAFDYDREQQQLNPFSHFPVSPATPAATTAVLPSSRSNEMLNLSSQHSSSSEDDEEEAPVSGGTRLFGVDLRANPIHKLAL